MAVSEFFRILNLFEYDFKSILLWLLIIIIYTRECLKFLLLCKEESQNFYSEFPLNVLYLLAIMSFQGYPIHLLTSVGA